MPRFAVEEQLASELESRSICDSKSEISVTCSRCVTSCKRIEVVI